MNLGREMSQAHGITSELSSWVDRRVVSIAHGMFCRPPLKSLKS